MVELTIEPGVGIGPVRLGMTRDEVAEAARSAGVDHKPRDGSPDLVMDGTLHVEYGWSGRVQHIGVHNAPLTRVWLHGVDVFDTPAANLVALLAASDDSGPHAYDEDQALFPNQIIVLWSAQEQYDRIRRQSGERPLRAIWAQVAIGSPEYLSAVTNG